MSRPGPYQALARAEGRGPARGGRRRCDVKEVGSANQKIGRCGGRRPEQTGAHAVGLWA